MNTTIESINERDIAELREIAEWFRQRGDHENAQFLANLATRYEVISGAYRTAAKALESTERRPLDVDEIDEIAQEQNAWGQGGCVQFDYRIFAREIEKRHGIAVPAWELAREYCS